MHAEPTVYIVDDDEGARNSVKALVRSIGVQAETFPSAEDFLADFDPKAPGCLVTDLRMFGMSGIDLLERLVFDGIQLPVVIITAHAETPLTVRALKNGAVTVLEKPCRDYELFDAIRAAIDLDGVLRSKAQQRELLSDRLSSLSPQEMIVLDYMMDGVANKVIAKRLDVSTRTIENRRQRIFEKTGTDSLAELVRLVVELRNATSVEA